MLEESTYYTRGMPFRLTDSVVFSSDFRTCRWHERVFQFTPRQAEVLLVLATSWQRYGMSCLSNEEIMRRVRPDWYGRRISDVFKVGKGGKTRMHDAWNVVIRSMASGIYGIALG